MKQTHIFQLSAAMAISLLSLACDNDPSQGCSTDSQCKGSRICVAQTCVDQGSSSPESGIFDTQGQTGEIPGAHQPQAGQPADGTGQGLNPNLPRTCDFSSLGSFQMGRQLAGLPTQAQQVALEFSKNALFSMSGVKCTFAGHVGQDALKKAKNKTCKDIWTCGGCNFWLNSSPGEQGSLWSLTPQPENFSRPECSKWGTYIFMHIENPEPSEENKEDCDPQCASLCQGNLECLRACGC